MSDPNVTDKVTATPESLSVTTNLPAPSSGVKNIKTALKDNLVALAEEESKLPLSAESKQILAKFVENASRGFVSVMPMVCRGESCPYITSCPLKAAGSKLPVSKRCPVEDTIASIQVSKHLSALNIENVDDPSHSFDVDMLCELAGLELLRWRCGVELAKNPKLIITEMVGATLEGEAIYMDKPAPIIDVMERTSKHIAKLRDALVATRKAQLEAGQDISDVSQRAADLRQKAEEAKKKRLEQIKPAEYKVLDN